MTDHPPKPRRAGNPSNPQASGMRRGEPTAHPQPADSKVSGTRRGEPTAHPQPADSKVSGTRRGQPTARVRSTAAGPSWERRSELTARLVHDVGKYLARTARNLPAGGVLDAALLDMLCRDLYGDGRSPRPFVRFTELAAELAPLLAAAPAPLPATAPLVAAQGEDAEPPLSVIRGELAELDGLEAQVRAGAPVAVLRAVELARRVEQQLRALAMAGQRPTKGRAR